MLELGDPHAGISKKRKILEKQDTRQDKRFESRTSRTKGPKAGRPAQSRTSGVSDGTMKRFFDSEVNRFLGKLLTDLLFGPK